MKTKGGSAAAGVNDARAMKGSGGGGSGGDGEHRMRETARSLATVLRIKVQLTGEIEEQKNGTRREKCQVSATKQSAPGDQKPATFFLLLALYSQSLLLLFCCLHERKREIRCD